MKLNEEETRYLSGLIQGNMRLARFAWYAGRRQGDENERSKMLRDAYIQCRKLLAKNQITLHAFWGYDPMTGARIEISEVPSYKVMIDFGANHVSHKLFTNTVERLILPEYAHGEELHDVMTRAVVHYKMILDGHYVEAQEVAS